MPGLGAEKGLESVPVCSDLILGWAGGEAHAGCGKEVMVATAVREMDCLRAQESTAESVCVLGASALAKGKVRLEMIHEKQANKNTVSFAPNAETTRRFTSPKTFQFSFT